MIHSHMSKLSELMKLFDTIDIQVRCLKNLGYGPDRYGPLLIPIIASNIHDDVNLIINRKFDSADSWDREMVLNELTLKRLRGRGVNLTLPPPPPVDFCLF